MSQVMFETFSVPAMYVSLQAILAIYASGRGPCIVLNCGDGVSNVVQVYKGYTTPSSYTRVDMGGRDLTENLMELLTARGYSFTSTNEREIVREMKEKLCYVAMDVDEDKNSYRQKSYELPDGHVITVGDECFCCPGLFRPSLIWLDAPGVHQMIYDSFMNCDIDTRKDLYCNRGGSTMFPCFSERLQKEMKQNDESKSVSPPERKYSVWIGWSVLGYVLRLWIMHKEYDEYGPSIVNRVFLM